MPDRDKRYRALELARQVAEVKLSGLDAVVKRALADSSAEAPVEPSAGSAAQADAEQSKRR